MSEKIALIVPTYKENPTSVQKVIDKYGCGLHDDSYKHKPNLRDKLLKQDNGRFKIYVYLSGTKRKEWSQKGSKKVDYIYHVKKLVWDNNKLIPCPDKRLTIDDKIGNHLGETPTRCWNYVEKVEPNPVGLNAPLDMNWTDFIDVETDKTLPQAIGGMRNPNSHWYYVYDDF